MRNFIFKTLLVIFALCCLINITYAYRKNKYTGYKPQYKTNYKKNYGGSQNGGRSRYGSNYKNSSSYRKKRSYYNKKRGQGAFNNYNNSGESHNTYAGYVLSLSWPAGYPRTKYTNSKLPINYENEFLIHGLWPDNVQFCPNFKNINFKQLDKKMLDGQKQYWPSLLGPNESFWYHEWTKHGTCLNTKNINANNVHFKAVKNVLHRYSLKANTAEFAQQKYFEIVLALTKSQDVFNQLKKHQIQPGTKRYNVYNMQKAFREEQGVENIGLVCQAKDGNSYLKEVRFCINLDLNLTNCKSFKRQTCKNSLFYPSKLLKLDEWVDML